MHAFRYSLLPEVMPVNTYNRQARASDVVCVGPDLGHHSSIQLPKDESGHE
jgi:hypothetical protein